MPNETEPKVRILIVDDNLFVRQQFRELLANNPHWEVCGEVRIVNGGSGNARDYFLCAYPPDCNVFHVPVTALYSGKRARREFGVWFATDLEAVKAVLSGNTVF